MYIHVSIIMQEMPSLHLYSVPVVVRIKERVNNHNNNSNWCGNTAVFLRNGRKGTES